MSNISTHSLRIALICGGPSLERGISLNSARSILDHLSSLATITPIYVDYYKQFYHIFQSTLYSNTPSDFDFKLTQMAKKLPQNKLIRYLSKEIDIVFPVIHGQFGEDGELQKLLEEHHIPFVGSSSKSCKSMFNKHRATMQLKAAGYPTLPTLLLHKQTAHLTATIEAFVKEHQLKRMIIKPVYGGSSIGVFSCNTVEEAVNRTQQLFDSKLGEQALLEPFCQGREFTVIVLENMKNEPVALIPSEIRVSYENGQLFSYRRKYLPTHNTEWLCPPSFEDSLIQTIREQAQAIFRLFSMRDFARLDGWVLNDGSILFSDFNPISGMEQNSFIFQQASRIGMTHQNLLHYLLTQACRRFNIPIQPVASSTHQPTNTALEPAHPKKIVRVVFGGKTAERQVSVMSGTNVWLKLRHSSRYYPIPYFLDSNGSLWELPYTYCLNHTTEEIYQNCQRSSKVANRLIQFRNCIEPILFKDMDKKQYQSHQHLLTKPITLHDFFNEAKAVNAFIFLGLHGGPGEDGSWQSELDHYKLAYNGSGPTASQLCMDKYASGQIINALQDETIQALPKIQIKRTETKYFSEADYQAYWKQVTHHLNSNRCIIKPQADGCSAGIVCLDNYKALMRYMTLKTAEKTLEWEAGESIEMPNNLDINYIIEPYWETDQTIITNNQLVYTKRTGWIELTAGLLETQGHYQIFNPSITVTTSSILTIEDKFQGGTGVNITPIPRNMIPIERQKQLKQQIMKIAKALKIAGYARIDLFFNPTTGQLIFIEANNLPALTPSTVIYHQALAEIPPLPPLLLIERIIENGIKRQTTRQAQTTSTSNSNTLSLNQNTPC